MTTTGLLITSLSGGRARLARGCDQNQGSVVVASQYHATVVHSRNRTKSEYVPKNPVVEESDGSDDYLPSDSDDSSGSKERKRTPTKRKAIRVCEQS